MRMSRRRSMAAPIAVLGLLAMIAAASLLAPGRSNAAAPNVREVTPAGITIDGSSGDWDSLSADFLADMFEAGNPDKDTLAKAYGRYDCGTETFYILVITQTGWQILQSDSDNYVKLGQSQKLVDGNS